MVDVNSPSHRIVHFPSAEEKAAPPVSLDLYAPGAGITIAASSAPSITTDDIKIVSDICDRYVDGGNVGHAGSSQRISRPELDMTEVVDRVLSETGNNTPEDIRCALNVLILASPIIDVSPSLGQPDQVASCLKDLGELEAVLTRSAAAIRQNAATPGEKDTREYLSELIMALKSEVAERQSYIQQNRYPKAEIANTFALAAELISKTPQGPDHIESLISNLTSARDDISQEAQLLLPETFIYKPLFDKHIKSIDSRIAALTQLRESNPLTEKAIFESKTYATEAAMRVITSARDAKPQGSSDHTILSAAIRSLELRIEEMRRKDGNQTLSKDEIRHLMGGTGKYIPGNPKDAPADIAVAIDGFLNSLRNPAATDDNSDTEDLSVSQQSDSRQLLTTPRDVGTMPLSHSKIREEGMMAAFTEAVFKAANVEVPEKKGFFARLFGTRNKGIDKLLRDAHLAVRDSKDWKNISKPIQVFNGGAMRTITSVITPQAGIALPSQNPLNRPILGEDKGEQRIDVQAPESISAFPDLIDAQGQQNGVNSHRSMAFHHAPHLAHSALKDEDGSVLFSATRHGTLSAYGISSDALDKMESSALELMVENLLPREQWKLDEQNAPSSKSTALRIKTDKSFRNECVAVMRDAAAFERAKDVVRATVAADPQLFLAAKQAARDGTSVPMNINQISLLTPDYARLALARIGILGASENEYDMTQEQYRAWDQVRNNGEPITLAFNDGDQQVEVSVRVNVNDFNFGVNQLGYMFGSTFRTPEVFTRNNNAMQSMFGARAKERSADIGGQVGDWLRLHPNASPTKRRHIETLANQISDIWHDQSFQSAGTEPYKLVSRLAVLTHMIGDYADFNCKSGKDRTGELDIEAKHLAAQIAATGEVPTPEAERSLEERANFFRMAIEGGNHEMQQYATGVAGYKIFGFKPLLEAISLNPNENGHGWQDKGESIRWFQGLSKSEGS